jgi:hypothetical protein
MRKFWGITGVLILLFSAFFVAAATGDILKGGDGKNSLGVLWGLLVFFSGTGIGGAVMIKSFLWNKVGPPQVSDFDQEQRVLWLAQNKAGIVTVPEAALHCRLSIEDAKHVLDRMSTQGVAELRFRDDGSYFYVFNGFVPPGYQIPGYLQQPNYQQPNYQQPNYQQPNYQPPVDQQQQQQWDQNRARGRDRQSE